MGSQWQNFLRNLGEWKGSFATFDPAGHQLSCTASILNLDTDEDESIVHFRLRRYGESGEDAAPVQDSRQEIRSLGKQVVFFDTGAFSKGSLQVSPVTPFGAEYGFVEPDRRLRFVQLFSAAGNFERLVLIREFRSRSEARERPPLTVEQLVGRWEGTAHTITADWPEASTCSGETTISIADDDRVEIRTDYEGIRDLQSGSREGRSCCFEGETPRLMNLLPDGASSSVPRQVSHRRPFHVEAGWLVTPGQRQRLIRRYNERGEWIASTHLIEERRDG